MHTDPDRGGRYSAARYFALVDEGLISPDDRVELLDGIIVSMPPHTPRHAAGVRQLQNVLFETFRKRAVVSSQLSFVAGTMSVPEPDFVLLPGNLSDYKDDHPSKALLVIKVSDSSLVQDRLTKSRIYAGANAPEYWIVNLRDRVVEWHADPDPDLRVYRTSGLCAGEERLPLLAFPDLAVRPCDLLP